MTEKTVAAADAGDFHFVLKEEDGRFKCMRSDVSSPAQEPEEVRDLAEIPSQVFNIFNKFMY